ncbi:type II toxin-antitoxin system RelE/ParE family toxin [Paucibacter sp. O1-1]|nr:type II toxin-antitoxin system RelE/ParE family toxin [Paucibacter sp. O1-1]MDA3827060.1 type II toxin-antitoxin system RelE/ParE family toxin [Paucibacter sp. O1-1]
MNSIQWRPKAFKQLRKLPAEAAKSITAAVKAELSDLSQARNVKKLVDHAYGYRLRVGNYRVFFEFDGAVRIVVVEEVRKRDEQSY